LKKEQQSDIENQVTTSNKTGDVWVYRFLLKIVFWCRENFETKMGNSQTAAVTEKRNKEWSAFYESIFKKKVKQACQGVKNPARNPLELYSIGQRTYQGAGEMAAVQFTRCFVASMKHEEWKQGEISAANGIKFRAKLKDDFHHASDHHNRVLFGAVDGSEQPQKDVQGIIRDGVRAEFDFIFPHDAGWTYQS
jgi:hypothetical protein